MTIYVIYHGPREHASVAFATSTEHLCVAFLGAPPGCALPPLSRAGTRHHHPRSLGGRPCQLCSTAKLATSCDACSRMTWPCCSPQD